MKYGGRRCEFSGSGTFNISQESQSGGKCSHLLKIMHTGQKYFIVYIF